MTEELKWTEEENLRLRILQSISKTKIDAQSQLELESLMAKKTQYGSNAIEEMLYDVIREHLGRFVNHISNFSFDDAKKLLQSAPTELSPEETKEWLMKVSSSVVALAEKLSYSLYIQAEVKGAWEVLSRTSCNLSATTSQWEAEAEAMKRLAAIRTMLAKIDGIVSSLQTLYYAARLQVDTLRSCLGLVQAERAIYSSTF